MRPVVVFIFLFFMHACLAQQDIRYDSAATDSRSFNASELNTYKADKDFQYNRYKEPPRSLWDRFWDWFWNRIGRILSTRGGAVAFKSTLTLLAILVLGYFIYKVSGMGKAGLFKRNAGTGMGYSVSDEDIHSINFDEAIDLAIQNNNYRLAVRLLYLQSLKKLADRNLINWQLNKTNIAYLQELQGSAQQPFFSNLTLQFENNWYGDLPITATEFEAVHQQFKQFNRQL
ncbi:MAG: DUF4129 domain-containing protein [Chitinophagaceae bacterium]